MQLQDRVALITGGKRIGAAIARALATRGADIALAFHRSNREAEDAAATVRAEGRRAVTIQADLSQPSECERFVAEAAAALGRVDILINMASVYRPLALDATDAAVWDATVNVDLRASFLCAQAAIPHMRRAGGGRIINFSDWVAASGRPRYKNFLPYYVAKRGVLGLTEALSL